MRPIHQILMAVTPQGASMKAAILPQGAEDVAPEDLNELLKWGRALRLPYGKQSDLLNLFFHPLPQGGYALGRVVSLNSSESEKTSALRRSLFIHYLIISPETLLSFGNNPISLYQEALASGKLSLVHRKEIDLAPFALKGIRKWFDKDLAAGMAINPGKRVLAALAQSTLNSFCTLFAGGPPAIHLLAALINFFPIHFRPKLSFTIGVTFSQETPVRLIGLLKKSPLLTDLQEAYPIPFLDLDKLTNQTVKVEIENVWCQLIYEILVRQQTGFFQRKILEEYFNAANSSEKDQTAAFAHTRRINELGRSWLAELNQKYPQINPLPQEDADFSQESASASPKLNPLDEESLRKLFRLKPKKKNPKTPLSISKKLKDWLLNSEPEETLLYFRDQIHDQNPQEPPYNPLNSSLKELPASPQAPRLEGHSLDIPLKIPQSEPLLVYGKGNRIFSPFQRLVAQWPQEETRLLELDALIERALTGEFSSIDRLSQYWTRQKETMNTELKWDIREEYIHFVQTYLTYENSLVKTSQKSLGALEILDLFLNENVSLGSFSEWD